MLKCEDGDTARAAELWNTKYKNILNYGHGFDPIYPNCRPTITESDDIIPRKYVLLSGIWFRSEGLIEKETGIQRGIRYRCINYNCRASSTYDLSTLLFTNTNPTHQPVEHNFEPNRSLINLPYYVLF